MRKNTDFWTCNWQPQIATMAVVMSPQRKANGKPAKRRVFGWWLGAGLFGVAGLAVVSSRHEMTTIKRNETGPASARKEDATGFAAYAKSATCQSCHQEAFQ